MNKACNLVSWSVAFSCCKITFNLNSCECCPFVFKMKIFVPYLYQRAPCINFLLFFHVDSISYTLILFHKLILMHSYFNYEEQFHQHHKIEIIPSVPKSVNLFEFAEEIKEDFIINENVNVSVRICYKN